MECHCRSDTFVLSYISKIAKILCSISHSMCSLSRCAKKRHTMVWNIHLLPKDKKNYRASYAAESRFKVIWPKINTVSSNQTHRAPTHLASRVDRKFLGGAGNLSCPPKIYKLLYFHKFEHSITTLKQKQQKIIILFEDFIVFPP